MKMMAGMLIGFVLAAVVMIAATAGLSSARADSSPASPTEVIPSSIANFYQIYTESLRQPFIAARAKITDPDIAQFYDKLIDRTGILKDSDAGATGNVTIPAPPPVNP